MQRIQKALAILGAQGVGLSAFGAHALEGALDAKQKGQWQTASLYLFVHVLAGLFASIACVRPRASILFFVATLIFSGSLYALALSQISWFGAITPLGGALFIVAWLFVVIDLDPSLRRD